MSPRTAGWDSVALAAALDWAGTRGTTAIVVLWRGRIAAERYWRGWNQNTDSIIASAGKSVSSVLTGVLIGEGRVRLDEPVRTYLGSGWSRSPATDATITVRQLLSMSSGLDDSLKFVTAPATRFYYNNPAYYQLFGVLGMQSASWRPYVDTGKLGYILSCTGRDMARFGLLVLNHGRWDGRQLVDSAWLATSLRPQAPDNPAYGWLWWLNGKATYRVPGSYLLPTLQGPIIPSAPSDLVAALGKGDKKIYVVPSLGAVVIRHGDEADITGNPFATSAFDEQLWQRLKLAFKY